MAPIMSDRLNRSESLKGRRQEQAQQLFGKGLAFHQIGRLEEAAAMYEKALKDHPYHYDALHLLGVTALQNNHPKRAAELIGKAIEIFPDNPHFHSNRGSALHALNELDAAVASYDRAIEITPDFAEALFNQGLALADLNKFEASIASYDRAISIKPDYAEAHCNRGNALVSLGQIHAALVSYDKAIKINANFAEAFCNRGLALSELKRFEAAVESYRQAIRLRPDYAEAHSSLGSTLADMGAFEEAITHYDQAIAIDSNYAEAFCNRGMALNDLKRFDHALANYDEAIRIDPCYYQAFNNRGLVLVQMRKLDSAILSYNRAISLRPNYAEAFSNRGLAQVELGQFEAALESYDRAIEIRSDFAEAHNNRGNTLTSLKNLDAAIVSFDKAIQMKPDLAEFHWNRSLALLISGDFERGWEEYEWRRQVQVFELAKQRFKQPIWLGETSLQGKTILLHSEQGLGDTIQFARYTKLIAEAGAKIIFETQPPLMRLLEQLEGVNELIPRGAVPSLPFDVHCPLMSLPFAHGTVISTIPRDLPYLKAEKAKSLEWKSRLGEHHKPRIGLVWSGGFRPDQPELWAVNSRRNIPLEKIAELRRIDANFYSLQKGEPAEGELSLRRHSVWPEPNFFVFSEDLKDFSDTAALIDNLDLVISVDTSTAHLAGAMGKPVWILNRYDGCWRWLLDTNDSPWYPTAKLYRQKKTGCWDDVMKQVQRDLAEFCINYHIASLLA